ncbi:MAG: DUF262 domain-containing HNH endonuclease family protein [Burkholderiales bacterium]|nr:DUF262 domain-containing HNH endonuclease family protein [Burkholderiales bacterium]
MKFTPTQDSIESLFKTSKFIIPDNQREYTWNNKNWEDFFLDIVEACKDPTGEPYFIGNCIFHKAENINTLSILDGQQRITSLIIVLAAIRDVYIAKNDITQSEFIQNTCLNKKYRDGKTIIPLLENDTLGDYFKYRIIQGQTSLKNEMKAESSLEKSIENSYNYFLKSINLSIENQEFTLDTFRDTIFSLEIIKNIVETEVDGYTLFETLNSRGQPLLLSDRIKNLILKFTSNNKKSLHASVWSKIRNSIDTTKNFDYLIEVYWILNYEKCSSEEIYRHIKKELLSNTNRDNYIDDFLSKLALYSTISHLITELKCEKRVSQESVIRMDDGNLLFNEQKNLDQMISSLIFFKTFKIKQVMPILISLIIQYTDQKIKENQLVNVIRQLEYFHFTFSICKKQANIYEKLYIATAKEINTMYSFVKLKLFIAELKLKLPSEEEFKIHMLEKRYSNHNKKYKNSKEIREFFNIIEFYKSKKINSFNLLTDPHYNIEHILSDDGNVPSVNIGNLVVIEETLNTKCRSKSFNEKIEIYKSSSLVVLQNFCKLYYSYENFENALINARSERLIRDGYNLIISNFNLN